MANSEYYEVGEAVRAADLRFARGVALLAAVKANPFVELVDVRSHGEDDVLVVEFMVELPQHPAVPIQPRERIAIAVGPDELAPPVVSALRKDFPDLLHLNLTLEGEPKSLCLFEEPYAELRSRLTPAMFVERIGRWLARAAVDGLHLPDQPLEPLLIARERIIIDPMLLDGSSDRAPLPLMVGCLSDDPPVFAVIRFPEGTDLRKLNERVRFVALPLAAPPWHARMIHFQPRDFLGLHRLLQGIGLDLEAEMRSFIRRLYEDKSLDGLRRFRVLLLLKLPKTRTAGGEEESVEWWAFVVDARLEDLAICLGEFNIAPGTTKMGLLLGTPVSSGLDQVKVYPQKPVFAFSKMWASLLAGYSPAYDPRIMVVGAGALGSQTVMNLARQGFGQWIIVDGDVMLPHNLGRHALYENVIGRNKADTLAAAVQALLNSEEAAVAVPCDFLQPGPHEEKLAAAIAECDVTLDLSASRAVSRELAFRPGNAGRICAFIAHSGQHLVILAEGQDRSIRLDDLDAQLAGATVESEVLQRAFGMEAGTVRYAGSCRDASVLLAQDVVAVFAGIIARFVRERWDRTSPIASVWEWNEETLGLAHHELSVRPVRVLSDAGWEIRLSPHAEAQMRLFRRRRLPNETGGVLLGEVDNARRVVYVAAALPSPADSIEWPAVYVRGAKGLRERINEAQRLSGHTLSYVGEWHSHPDGIAAEPSTLDRQAFDYLMREMSNDGLPAVMLIQGERQQPGLLIGC